MKKKLFFLFGIAVIGAAVFTMAAYAQAGGHSSTITLSEWFNKKRRIA